MAKNPIDELPWKQLVDLAPEGVVVCLANAPQPVCYVNAAFERLTGYSAAELLGQNLRLLQADDQDQVGLKRLREAMVSKESCRVLLRNYRKNGELFWNEIELRPLQNAQGEVTHLAGFHRDAAGLQKVAEREASGVATWLREDRVTGLSSEVWFQELFLREWNLARRESRPLSLALLDVDELALYNETFGRIAGDSSLRRLARTLGAAFRRGTDVLGRTGDSTYAVLVTHRNAEEVAALQGHLQSVLIKLSELRIHHPRAMREKFLAVTAGLATVTPHREETAAERLHSAALDALKQGKAAARGRLTIVDVP